MFATLPYIFPRNDIMMDCQMLVLYLHEKGDEGKYDDDDYHHHDVLIPLHVLTYLWVFLFLHEQVMRRQHYIVSLLIPISRCSEKGSIEG